MTFRLQSFSSNNLIEGTLKLLILRDNPRKNKYIMKLKNKYNITLVKVADFYSMASKYNTNYNSMMNNKIYLKYLLCLIS